MRLKLSKEQEDIIISLYRSGKTVSEIRNIIGIKWIQPITNVLKRNYLGNFESTKRKNINTQENINNIIQLRSEGLNVFQIGEKLGFYPQFVTNVLKRAGFFQKKETLYRRKYTINHNYFMDIDTAEKCYILGFICADGHIAKNYIEISVSKKDIDILEKIRKAIGSDAKISHYISENPYKNKNTKEFCEMCNLKLCSVTLANSLSFIPKNKTYNLDSSVLNHIPKEYHRDFLRGYFDGDGNILYGKKYSSGIKYNINVCGNKEFLENTFNKYFPSTNQMYFMKKSKQCWVWKISSKQKVEDFLRYIYEDSDIYLDRKFDIYKCAHIKPIELLETPLGNPRVISSEASLEERSETIETQLQ